MSRKDGDTEVIWEKGQTKHQYTIVKDGKETILEKTGGNVPEEVRKLGFEVVSTQSGDFNLVLRGQHDPIFLNNDPRGAAELISKLGDLNRLSRAVDFCSSDIKKDKREVKVLQSQKLETEKKLEIYAEVDDISDSVIKVEGILANQIHPLEEQITWIESSLIVLGDLKRQIKVLESKDFSGIPEVQSGLEKIARVSRIIEQMSDLLEAWVKTKSDLPSLESRVSALKVLPSMDELETELEMVEQLETLSSQKSTLEVSRRIAQEKVDALDSLSKVDLALLKSSKSTLEDMQQIVDEKVRLVEQIGKAEEKISSSQKKIDEVEEKRKKFKVCPLCGNQR